MTEPYVTNGTWMHPTGRADAIDDVADQFERPVAGREAFWTSQPTGAWPLSSSGWLSRELMHPSHLERRAG